MYDLPALENAKKVVIDYGSVNSHIKPILIYSDHSKSTKNPNQA